MIDDRHVLACGLAIRAGQEIAFYHFNSHPGRPLADDPFNPCHSARGTDETDQVAKPVIYQAFYYARSNETRSPGYQYPIIWGDNEGFLCRRLQGDALRQFGLMTYSLNAWSYHILLIQERLANNTFTGTETDFKLSVEALGRKTTTVAIEFPC